MYLPKPVVKFKPPPLAVADSLTGIIKRIIEVQMERSDPRVFVVAAQTADTAIYGFPTTAGLNGSGAGLNLQAAYGAAIGESVERYACCILHSEDLIYGSYDELRQQGYLLTPPEKWALFHPNQYDRIPYAPFLRDTPIAWARAESLTYCEERWVPACLVYMSSSQHLDDYGCKRVGTAISTGAACSSSRAEALLKGICEVVERDAFIITWRNSLSLPRIRIDPQSTIYPLFQEKFARPGLEYNLIYTTLDLSIPSFFGFLRDTRRDPPAILVGGAAHPDPCIGVVKTLLELVQGLKWLDYIKYQPFPVEAEFRNVQSFNDRMRLYAFNDMYKAFHFLTGSSDEIDLSAIPSIDTRNPSTNLHQCCNLLAERGLEVIGLDLTPVDVNACGLNVIKVLIPECEPMESDHRFPFLGGHRWREVPTHLRMCSSDPSFESLNPYPHPYP